MSLEQLLAFNLVLLAALVSPGPAFLVSIQTTLSSGRASGIALGFGLAFMAAGWTTTALLGLETIFHVFPWAYTLVRTLGAIYLIYIAIQMWRGAKDELKSKAQLKHSRSFWNGILINALNPKSVFFAAAVLVVIFPPHMTAFDNALVIANHFIVEVIFYACLAFFMSIKSVRAGYIKLKKYLDRTASIVLGGLGVRLLTDR